MLKQNSKLFTTSVLWITVILIIKEIQGQEVTPSPPSTPTSHANTSLISPTQTPLPQYTCRTGPDTQDFDFVIMQTNNIYLDLSEPVSCSGYITRWHYCRRLFGFREAPAGLWPCVWRRSNSSEEEFEIVGCNNITLNISYEGEIIRCQSHDPTLDPDEVIFVEEGDYIGFYIPESGLVPGLALPDHDQGHFQLRRGRPGFVTSIIQPELESISCTPNCGRAPLNAEIGMSIC